MNRMKLFVITLLAIAPLYLISQNSMPIIQTFIGEYENAWMGEKLVSMDYNGDGIDDLIIFTLKAGPEQGLGFYVYYGGQGFDAIPDLTKNTGPIWLLSTRSFLNAGDVNGDGYEDLLSLEYYYADYDSVAIHFYHGGPNADLLYDQEILTQGSWDTPRIEPRSRLGDVNNDGYDDIGCSVWAGGEYYSGHKLAVLYGHTWELQIISDTVDSSRRRNIEGVGDTNGDDIDDFVTGYAVSTPDGRLSSRYLHLGGSTNSIMNPILMYQRLNFGEWDFSAAYGIGDYNGDGYDDMVYCNGDSWYDNNKIRLGGPNILNTPEITVISSQIENMLFLGSYPKIAYGDFNGDGNSDLAGSDFRAFLWTGHAGIWLGNANPNGLFDLRISSPPSSPDQQFGMTLAAGDFNDDGYSDLAIAAPHSISSGALHYPGYVYIFGGNTQFVTNEDLLSIPEPDSIEMNYYPNPINGKARQINFRVAGKMPDKIHEAEFTIHNIKGQKVERISYDITKLKSGEGVLNTSKLIPGVYLITLWVDGKAINREKIAIK